MTQLNIIIPDTMESPSVGKIDEESKHPQVDEPHTLGPRDRGKRCLTFISRPSRTCR